MRQGEYPDKKYVQKILNDLDTRLTVLNYIDVRSETLFDTEKMNSDWYCIEKDLSILYDIVNTLATEKYIQLQAYVNGYLLSLEEIADRAEKKAMEEIGATTLGASLDYFIDHAPSMQYINNNAVLYLGTISCTPQSRIYTTIEGSGFQQKNVVFSFGSDKLSPYSVNGDTLKVQGSLSRNTYQYTVPAEQEGNTFKILEESLTADASYHYEIFGGKDKVSCVTSSSRELKDIREVLGTYFDTPVQISFYLTDATRISFDFSTEPSEKNFNADTVSGLKRDKAYHFTFGLPAGSSFSFTMDGTAYATKETPSVNGNELYISNYTQATDFLIREYVPGEKATYASVTITIYDVSETNFHIDSITVKEIPDIVIVEGAGDGT